MLNNNYLTFGNSILQKYCGMTSRINPLALVFLQKEEEEEAPQASPATIFNVQNYHYRTNRYIYNHIVNRYVQNYNHIVSVLRSNSIYAESPNFKMDIHPVQMNHTSIQTKEELETVVKQVTEQLLKEYVRVDQVQEKTTEVLIKKMTEGLSSEGLKVLPIKVREKVFSEITREVQEKVLPLVWKQTDTTTLTGQTTKILQQTVETVIEQNAGRLPRPVMAETAARLTQELSVRLTKEWKTIIEAAGKQKVVIGEKYSEHTTEKQIEKQISEQTIKQKTKQITEKKETSREGIRNLIIGKIEPYIMAISPGTSRSVIRQEILKVCNREEAMEVLTRELENLAGAVEARDDTAVIRGTIQLLLQEIVEHTDTCRRGKEKFERQIVSRLTPLPVRPVSLEFRREQQETEGASQGQLPIKEETTVIQQKVVQMIRKEQTAERKYYTHFVDKFLNASKEQKREEIDRSTLPAGIIYHQKPKETVQFVNRDIIRLPLEMLPPNQTISSQEREPGTERNRRETDREEAIRQETVVRETIRQEAVRIENNVIREINKEIEKDIVIYPEHTERRVIRRSVPEFTARGNSTAGQYISVSEIPSKERAATGYLSAESEAPRRSGTLELVLLTHEGQEPDANAAETGRTVQGEGISAQRKVDIDRNEGGYTSANVGFSQSGVRYPQAMAISGQSIVAPMELIHKLEENRKDGQEEENASRSPKTIENIQPDIVFTKEIVTKQNIENVISESVQKQQQVIAAGQSAGSIMPGQSQVMTNGQFGMQPQDQVAAVRMERMISESVSRKMDENIPEITRQVYRNLERQIKKEQERRGI